MKKHFRSHQKMRTGTLNGIISSIINGSRTKRQIQEATGLSWGAVSKGITELVKKQVIFTDEKVTVKEGAGRKTETFAVNPKRNLCVGFEIREKAVIGSLVTLSGAELKSINYEFTGEVTGESVYKILRNAFSALLGESGIVERYVNGIQLSLSGAVDKYNLVWLTTPRVPSVRNIGFKGLSNIFPFVKSISVEHDVNALAASVVARKREGDTDFVLLHISHGIGCALFRNGQFFSGSRGFAGEIGHIPYSGHERAGTNCYCGKKGCVETVINTKGIRRYIEKNYGEMREDSSSYLSSMNPEQVEFVYNSYIEEALIFLAVTAVNLYDPETLIIGGRAIEPWKKSLENHFETALRKQTWLGGPKHVRFFEESEFDSAQGAAKGVVQFVLKDIIGNMD